MKKTMIAVISVTLLAILAIGVFAACKKKTAEGNTIKVLNYTDLTAANAAQSEKWMWDTFRQNNPDVVLDKEDLYNEPFLDKTNAYIASGNLPDVLYVWPSGRSTGLHQNRLLKDLAPLIRKDNLQNSFIPLALNPSQQASGYLAMLPQGITATHMFMVNMEVLNDCGLKPAKTYAELKAQVPVLKAKGYETIIMPNKDTWVMQSCLFSVIAGRFCGTGWEERILSGKAKFTDPDFVAALSFIRQLYEDGVIPKSSLGIAYGEGPGMFATNKGAYYIDGDWRVGAFLTDSSTGEALLTPARQKNILITVFPVIENAKINKTNSAVLGTGWAMNAAIPAGSEREEAAWRLIKWLVSPEALTHRMESGGVPTPSRSDIDFSKVQLEPLQISLGSFAKEYDTSTVVIDAVFHADVYEPINDGLVELGLGQKTGAQVADAVQKAFNAWKAAN